MPSDAQVQRAMLVRLLEGGYDELSGIPAGLLETVTHPVSALDALLEAHKDQLRKAGDRFSEGRIVEGLGHGAAGLLPGVGPAAAMIGEEIAETGDVARGVGRGAAMVGSMAAPAALLRSVRGARALPSPPPPMRQPMRSLSVGLQTELPPAMPRTGAPMPQSSDAWQAVAEALKRERAMNPPPVRYPEGRLVRRPRIEEHKTWQDVIEALKREAEMERPVRDIDSDPFF